MEQLLWAAQQHLQRNELAEAEAISQRVLRERPNLVPGLMLGALLAAMTRNYPRAEHLLGRVLQREPTYAPALCMLGRVHRDCGKAPQALNCLMRGLQGEFRLPKADDAMAFWHSLVEGAQRAAPIAVWRHRLAEFEAFAWALEASGRMREHSSAACGRLAAIDPCAMPAGEAGERTTALLALAAFSRSSSADWNRAVFEQVALPWMNRSLRADQYDVAFVIERTILTEYVAQNETEAHFAATVGCWSAEMRAAGRRLADRLPALSPRKPGALPRVAFFAHMLGGLAHIRLMVDTLEGHAALAEPLIKPFVFGLRSTWDEATSRRLTDLGIELCVSDFGPSDARASELVGLREALSARDIDAVVWVSYVHLMPFAFAMRVAPVQIWWAMKYHSLSFPEIDGYLTGGGIAGGTRQIGGRSWRAGPVAAEDWFDPARSADAAKLRSGYGRHAVLYGCFGREEKLNSPSFLSAVVEVLKAVPEAGFLWTGKEHSPDIQSALDAGGVADRCTYIGWVDTRLYAQVIDVFLDSFPFPCGYTLYESLAAGKPAVLFASAEAAETGARSTIEPVLDGAAGTADQQAGQAIFRRPDGENLYLCAVNRAQYVDYAVRLGRDSEFRQAAGAAGARFVREFMSDRRRLGRIYGEHLAAIVREATAR